jgi:hypothetical protein
MRGYPPNSFFASNMVHPPIKQPRGLFIPDWHQRWKNKDEPRVIQDDIYRMYNGWFPLAVQQRTKIHQEQKTY